MKVFNVYMKIIKNNLPSIIIYVIVFGIISIVMANTAVKGGESNFNQSKTQIAFFDEDNTDLTNRFKKNLEGIVEIQPLEDDTDKLRDALFFRKIGSIVRIEKGFTQKLMSGEDVCVEVNTIPNTYNSRYVELAINNYINTAKAYLKTTDLQGEELLNRIGEDLNKETETKVVTEAPPTEVKSAATFFNYVSYVLMATIILGVGATMGSINERNIKRRITCSPISNRRLNLELTLGHFVYSIVLLALFIFAWFAIRLNLLLDPHIWVMILNAICMMLATLSIAFLVGMIVKSKSAQSGAANVIALGTSFISGVFVPIEWLSASVTAIANFTPIYWFVKANTAIQELGSFDFESMKPILMYMVIQLGFAITFWLIALVISKHKRTSD